MPKKSEIILAVVSFIVGGSSVPVIWRALCFLLAFIIVLHLFITSWRRTSSLPHYLQVVLIVLITTVAILRAGPHFYEMWRTERAAESVGYLSPIAYMNNPPSQFQIGNGGPIFQYPDEEYKIVHDAGITVVAGEKELFISTTVRDKFGQIFVSIENNRWRVSSLCWDKNSTNNALEVLDQRGHVVLQVKLLADRVQIQGEWRDELGNGWQFRKSPKSSDGQLIRLSKDHLEQSVISRMFKYPSSEHWGELVE